MDNWIQKLDPGKKKQAMTEKRRIKLWRRWLAWYTKSSSEGNKERGQLASDFLLGVTLNIFEEERRGEEKKMKVIEQEQEWE